MKYYTLFHIAESTIIPNCGLKLSKKQWKNYFKNGGIIVWSPEHNLYWNMTRKSNKRGGHPEYLILDRNELEIIEVEKELPIEEYYKVVAWNKEELKILKEEAAYFKRL